MCFLFNSFTLVSCSNIQLLFFGADYFCCRVRVGLCVQVAWYFFSLVIQNILHNFLLLASEIFPVRGTLHLFAQEKPVSLDKRGDNNRCIVWQFGAGIYPWPFLSRKSNTIQDLIVLRADTNVCVASSRILS